MSGESGTDEDDPFDRVQGVLVTEEKFGSVLEEYRTQLRSELRRSFGFEDGRTGRDDPVRLIRPLVAADGSRTTDVEAVGPSVGIVAVGPVVLLSPVW